MSTYFIQVSMESVWRELRCPKPGSIISILIDIETMDAMHPAVNSKPQLP